MAEKKVIVDAMLGICAHDPDVLLAPPSNIKSTAEGSLNRGLVNASLSVDAKTGYVLTQGGINFTTVEQNAQTDLPEQMRLFMEKNGLDTGKYEIKYFSENLRDDIKVLWAAAVRKK
ncbi:MAG: hypothetical protein MIO92_00390 [Methanosarcinaceae archaeon]|nr:hypothetical protein [Methanosarcinaceae archaeon]